MHSVLLKEHEEKNERYGAEDRDRHDLSIERIKGLLEGCHAEWQRSD
jgi:hypothetical protein